MFEALKTGLLRCARNDEWGGDEKPGRVHDGEPGECTLYVGVTSDLVARVHQHRSWTVPGFTARYGCRLLVWFEQHSDMLAAIAHEKQIKAGSRARKIMMIRTCNPQWRDLFEDLV